MTNESLIACPFCGGKAELCSGMHEWWVKCTSCDASTQMQGLGKQNVAIEQWNTRRTMEPVSIKDGAEAVKAVFDLSLVGPDSGFKAEDVAEALAKRWRLSYVD